MDSALKSAPITIMIMIAVSQVPQESGGLGDPPLDELPCR
jgi:hypothetical protein